MVGNNGATTYQHSGTPVFMAPEVARGEEQGFPTYVWALVCSVIEMATGSNAYGFLSLQFFWLPEEGKDILAKCLHLRTFLSLQNFWICFSSINQPERKSELSGFKPTLLVQTPTPSASKGDQAMTFRCADHPSDDAPPTAGSS
ncbi:hypothetical protein L1887_12980 [Cichorium endivia]|nr:hypothetical protein L1887_12980 [Cichorium endivia]